MNVVSDSYSDMAPRQKAEILLLAALAKKAANPVLLRLAELTSFTDYFLIVSAQSARQVKAIADSVLAQAKQNRIAKFSEEGISQGNWALLDYGDVIVHVFRPSVRDFYDLEGLWAEAPRERFSAEINRQIQEIAEEATDEFED
jgi:ribosome silencing factor RsfS/YbeB/iojap